MGTGHELFIQEYGEIAKPYLERAIPLGVICVVENFDISSILQEALTQIMSGRNQSRFGVVDIKIFAKPQYGGFEKDKISTRNISSLFNFTTKLYPDETDNFKIDDYWDEIDIFRSAKELNADEFVEWIKEKLSISYSKEQWERKQAKNVHIFIKEIIAKLFCAWVQKVSLYCIVDDSNENTGFAPYIIVGGTCLLVIGQKWDL